MYGFSESLHQKLVPKVNHWNPETVPQIIGFASWKIEPPTPAKTPTVPA